MKINITEYINFNDMDKNNLYNKYFHFSTEYNNIKNNTIYKFIKENNKYLTFQELNVENFLPAKIQNVEHYKYFKDVSENGIYNYKIINFNKKFVNLLMVYLIDDITNYYLLNNILYYNYDTSEFKTNSKQLLLKGLLYRYIETIHQGLRKPSIKVDELFLTKYKILKEYEEDIKKMGLYMKYKDIFFRYQVIYNFEKIERVYNESCPVCLSHNKKLFKGFYFCCHCCCLKCLNSWNKRTCSICRAHENITFEMVIKQKRNNIV